MDLELSPEQRDVVSTFEHVLARESTTERVRAAADDGFDPALWTVLSEMGVVGVALDEADGGTGGGMVDLTLITEVLGRHLGCVPVVEAAVAAGLLAELGAEVPHRGAPVVMCPRPAVAGVARAVPGGVAARAVVALDGDELVLVAGPAGPAGAELGFLGQADRPLSGDVERTVLAVGAAAGAAFGRARSRWQLATAAALIGVADGALRAAVAYATIREQFGVPIGSFQAIAHLLARAVIDVDGGRLLVRETAWRHDHGIDGENGPWPVSAEMALAHAGEAAVAAAEACLHVHGGYGFSLEYDAQLFLRRAKALQLQGGDPAEAWERIGAACVAVPDRASATPPTNASGMAGAR